MYHYVYRITNKKIRKHYYGSRTSKVRPKDDLGKIYLSSSKYLKDDIKKFGIDSFIYKVLFVTDTRADAYRLENKLQKRLNVVISDHFYNRSVQPLDDSFSFHNITHTKSSREAISKSLKGRTSWNKGKKWDLSKEERSKKFGQHGSTNPFYGKSHSGETKLKIKLNQPNSFGANNSFYGKSHSDETKEKLSNLRSIPIMVTFANGHLQSFKNRLQLGPYLNRSTHLGAKLLKEDFKYLWANYNIIEIKVSNED